MPSYSPGCIAPPGEGQRRSAQSEGSRTASTSATGEGAARTQTTTPALDPHAERALQALRRRDQEVRTHELAHLGAAGQYALGGPRYTYQTGPDGGRYAIGGEVPVDTGPVAGDARATLQKAMQLRRAALAPAHPSGADLAIAAQASNMAAQAQQDLSLDTKSSATAQPGTPKTTVSDTKDGDNGDASPPTVSGATHHLCSPNCLACSTVASSLPGTTVSTPPLVSARTAVQSYQRAASGY